MNASVGIERTGGVETLTLERPAKRNALTPAMYAALADAVAAAAADDDVRVLRLRGAGDDFTAGNDLGEFRTMASDAADSRSTPLGRFLHAVVDFPKPLVAEVHGNAIGIGTTLLLHCDLVVAATDARFQLPFARLGLVPELASSQLLPERVGSQEAARLLLLGDAFDADEARRLGLVAHVCAPAALGPVTLAWCRRLAGMPPGAVMATLGLLRSRERRERLHAVIDAEWRVFRERLASDEHREALAALLEGRDGR